MATKAFNKSAHQSQKVAAISDTKKDRALAALLESCTIVAAAQKAQIGESTLRRWLHEDEDFRFKLRQQRQQALGHAALRLQQRASEAVEVLFDSLASGKPVEPGRAAMLRTALDFAFRAGSYNDLAERLDVLERAAKDEQEGLGPGRHDWASQDRDEPAEATPAAVNGHDTTGIQ